MSSYVVLKRTFLLFVTPASELTKASVDVAGKLPWQLQAKLPRSQDINYPAEATAVAVALKVEDAHMFTWHTRSVCEQVIPGLQHFHVLQGVSVELQLFQSSFLEVLSCFSNMKSKIRMWQHYLACFSPDA